VLALVTVAYSFLVTLALLKVTDLAVGLWVGAKEEGEGLDLSQHGEVGYRLSDMPEEVAEPSPVTQPPRYASFTVGPLVLEGLARRDERGY